MLDVLFCNACIITMEDSNAVIPNGFVGVRGKDIVFVGEQAPEEPAKRRLDCQRHILLPGLVNTHTHTAMCVMRGYADDYRLQEWLEDHVLPAEARLDQRAVVAGARLGFAEMIRSGTTSISDMYFSIPAIAHCAVECGIRATLSNATLSMDPSHFAYDQDNSIRELQELLNTLHGADEGRIRAEASIHGEYTSAPEIWEYVRDIALEKGLRMHLHLSETRSEQEACLARYGKTPTRMFYEHGVFDVPALAAHCVWVTQEDMELLAQKGVSAAHNPVSNLKLASGIARVGELKRHGVNVSLGTDGCCSNNSHDLFEEIKLAALLQKGVTHDPTALCAYEALKMATVNGAIAQGREHEIGRIREGLRADIILLDLRAPHLQPVYHPVSTVVYSARGSDVSLTMVQGKVLYENGVFTTIDLEKTMAEANGYAVPRVLGAEG